MKVTAKFLILICTLGVLLTYSSCKKPKPPEPTLEEQQLTKLSKTWKVTSVKKDNVDQTGYSNFVLTISGTAGSPSYVYTTAGRPALSPWPPNGNWTFGSDIASQILRDKGTADELAITYSVSETTLQLSFTFNGTGFTGRAGNVKGQWVMTFGL